jgi:hypothetical protein
MHFIAMKMGDTKGNVTIPGYEDWIDVTNVKIDRAFGAGDAASTVHFKAMPSNHGQTTLDINFPASLPLDTTKHMCKTTVFPTVDIVFFKSIHKKLTPYKKLHLIKVRITHCKPAHNFATVFSGHVSITLSPAGYTLTYTAIDEKGNPKNPYIVEANFEPGAHA